MIAHCESCGDVFAKITKQKSHSKGPENQRNRIYQFQQVASILRLNGKKWRMYEWLMCCASRIEIVRVSIKMYGTFVQRWGTQSVLSEKLKRAPMVVHRNVHKRKNLVFLNKKWAVNDSVRPSVRPPVRSKSSKSHMSVRPFVGVGRTECLSVATFKWIVLLLLYGVFIQNSHTFFYWLVQISECQMNEFFTYRILNYFHLNGQKCAADCRNTP